MAQKMIIAMCLFGAVAYASAQSLDLQTCANAIRYEADRYREALIKSTQSFTNSLQNSGSQAVDTSGFQENIDKLVQSITSMADLSQGFDASRFMTAYMENISTMGRILRQSMRLSLITGAMREYIQFGNKLYTANTDFLERVTNSCLPTNKRILLPADA